MPTRIAGSSAAAIAPETEEKTTQPTPVEVDSNQLAEWKSPAADEAFKQIEQSDGWVFHDDEEIKKQLSSVRGFDLLYVMGSLEDQGHLDRILDRMSPNERQALVQQAVQGGLISPRDSQNSKLTARYRLPESFQAVVDDLNRLGEGKAKNLQYKWSSYQQTAPEALDASMKRQVASLKEGDSVQVSAKAGGYGAMFTGAQAGSVSVARTEKGFVVSGELGVEGGVHFHDHHHQGKAELTVGVAARAEYTYETADDAYAAARLMATAPGVAAERLGMPDAIELKGKGAAELVGYLGPDVLKAAKAAAGADVEVALRIEGDAITLKGCAKGELKAAAMMKAMGVELEPHAGEVKGESKIEIEAKFHIKDASKLAGDPVSYLKANGLEMAAHAELKTTISTERVRGHHGTATEATFTTSPHQLAAFVSKAIEGDRQGALMELGKSVDVDLREKHLALQHAGYDAKVDVDAGGFEASVGFERKHVESERVIYRGSATSLLQSP